MSDLYLLITVLTFSFLFKPHKATIFMLITRMTAHSEFARSGKPPSLLWSHSSTEHFSVFQ